MIDLPLPNCDRGFFKARVDSVQNDVTEVSIFLLAVLGNRMTNARSNMLTLFPSFLF